jgi:hypothetical protein
LQIFCEPRSEAEAGFFTETGLLCRRTIIHGILKKSEEGDFIEVTRKLGLTKNAKQINFFSEGCYCYVWTRKKDGFLQKKTDALSYQHATRKVRHLKGINPHSARPRRPRQC